MTAKAAVIGWPLRHTRSPLIHNHWLAAYGIDGRYDARPIAPENLSDDVARMVDQSYVGFNVTVPHKQTVMDLLDHLHPDAARIGAVNTVVIRPDATLEGRNTDAFGFVENLRANAPDAAWQNGPAVVLGAGGAARAVVCALVDAGLTDIRICNRTVERARALAAAFSPATAHGWDAIPELAGDAALVVNTTTLGMEGQAPLTFDFTHLRSGALVNDIVYTPLVTPFLAAARDAGHPVVTGIGMLLHQARPAFQAWFGVMPDIDAGLMQKVLA